MREKKTYVTSILMLLLLSGCQFKSAEKPGGGPPKNDRYSGQELFIGYGCVACHHISDMLRSTSWMAPPLDHWKKRKFIVGKFPNNKAQLVKWIRKPNKMDPNTTMPNLNVSQKDAEDMADYLLSLD